MNTDKITAWFVSVGWALLVFGFSGAMVYIFKNRESLASGWDIVGVLFTGTILSVLLGQPLTELFPILPLELSGFICGLGGQVIAGLLLRLIQKKADETEKKIQNKIDDETTA